MGFQARTNAHQHLIFLHVPKAAGNSLKQVIRRQYGLAQTYTIRGFDIERSHDEFRRLAPDLRERYRVVMGHMGFGLHQLFRAPSTYITLLRDPVDRIVSHYHYVLQNTNHYLHQTVTQAKMDIVDYISAGLTTELDNGQTRVIAGLEHHPIDLIDEEAEKTDIVGYGCCGDEHLERAQANLDQHFAVIGLSERFDESLLVLQHVFGWQLPFYSKANITKKRKPVASLSDEARRAIQAHTLLDRQLYDHATKALDAKIAEQTRVHFDLKKRLFSAANPRIARASDALNRVGQRVQLTRDEETSARSFHRVLTTQEGDRSVLSAQPDARVRIVMTSTFTFTWLVELRDNSLIAGQDSDTPVDATMSASGQVWSRLAEGTLSVSLARKKELLHVSGDEGVAYQTLDALKQNSATSAVDTAVGWLRSKVRL